MTARVVYHYEAGTWWIESPEHPGYVAVAPSRAAVTELARSGLPFFVGDATLEVVDLDPPSVITASNQDRDPASEPEEGA